MKPSRTALLLAIALIVVSAMMHAGWNLIGKGYVGARWLLTRTGPGASNQFESAAFIRSAAGVDYPDIQYHFLPIAVRYDGKGASEGFQAHVGPMRSKSRGASCQRSAALSVCSRRPIRPTYTTCRVSSMCESNADRTPANCRMK